LNRFEIQPLEEEHLDGAAVLLANRHRRHCVAEPLLKGDVDFRARIEALLGADGASGWVAVDGDEVAGYVVGAPRSAEIWGRNVWVEAAGHAALEPELVRDLYGVAAARWVDEGNTRHSVLVPASEPELLDAWWRLSFGHQQSHGIQELPDSIDDSVPDGFEIRDPDGAEIEALIDLDLALPEHQRKSPVFGGRNDYSREESRAEWLKTLEKGEEKILIGARQGRPVACWALVPVEQSNENRELFLTDGNCFLGFAATLPESRGSGVGVALTNASFAWAREQGYESMSTDWRETNLLASRFWPRRGFRRTFLRLYRSIP
jgi:ribosomal protein S18 acetylase RimI-like enzyme